MSARAKFHVLVFVVFPVGAMTLLWLGMTTNKAFLSAAFAYTFLIGLLTFLIRCPNCDALLLWQGYLILPLVPKRCRSCGHNLTSRTRKARQDGSDVNRNANKGHL